MVNVKSFGTKDIPLKLAKKISEEVNALWKSGDFMQKVSPVTQELLNFWNPEGTFAEEREFNFHEGQWQAILMVFPVVLPFASEYFAVIIRIDAPVFNQA